jgi:hypothetical protein
MQTTWIFSLLWLCEKLMQEEIRTNYPEAFITRFGHASIMMLIDGTDQDLQAPTFRDLHSMLWSQYYQQTGAKFAIGCTPTGMVPHSWCSEAYPSSITDPNIIVATGVTKENLLRGDIVEIDTGFLIENYCAALGIWVMRPTQFCNKLKQQSKSDSQKREKKGTQE